MYIFIEPHETLLFRNGRPFDAGETSFAETLFPPTPETLQGAIRELLARNWERGKDLATLFGDPALTALIGNRKSYGRFRITTIAIGRRLPAQDGGGVELLYPVPAHLVKMVEQRNGHREERFVRLKPFQPAGMISNLPPSMLPLYPEGREQREAAGKESVLRGWLRARDLARVLSESAPLSAEAVQIIPDEEIFVREPRSGIGRDDQTRTTIEGLLYTVFMVRMKENYGLVVELRLAREARSMELESDEQTATLLRLPKPPASLTGTLGGERRPVTFRLLDPASEPVHVASPQPEPGARTLLYLTTPAALQEGWRPAIWPAPVCAAAIPGYQLIGGWQMNPEDSGGQSKHMRRCVPAGSVYFFDRPLTDWSGPLSDYGREIGYGISILGGW